MATTFKLIDKTTLTGSQANITFTGLGSYSSDYTDLLILCSIRTDRANTWDYINTEFNSSSSNLSFLVVQGGDGTTYTSSGSVGRVGTGNGANATANTFSNHSIYIPNFSSSDYKSISTDSVGETNASNGTYADLTASLWSSISAITSIKLLSGSGSNFVSGTSVYLYGIKNS